MRNLGVNLHLCAERDLQIRMNGVTRSTRREIWHREPIVLISDEPQLITYTDFKKVKTIEEGNNTLTLTYGIDEQRRKAVFTGDRNLTRYYLGDYEEDHTGGQVRKIHYLSGGNGLAAIYATENGTGTMYFAHTDYLGSLTALSDQTGNVVERYAFDPWGK